MAVMASALSPASRSLFCVCSCSTSIRDAASRRGFSNAETVRSMVAESTVGMAVSGFARCAAVRAPHKASRTGASARSAKAAQSSVSAGSGNAATAMPRSRKRWSRPGPICATRSNNGSKAAIAAATARNSMTEGSTNASRPPHPVGKCLFAEAFRGRSAGRTCEAKHQMAAVYMRSNTALRCEAPCVLAKRVAHAGVFTPDLRRLYKDCVRAIFLPGSRASATSGTQARGLCYGATLKLSFGTARRTSASCCSFSGPPAFSAGVLPD